MKAVGLVNSISINTLCLELRRVKLLSARIHVSAPVRYYSSCSSGLFTLFIHSAAICACARVKYNEAARHIAPAFRPVYRSALRTVIIIMFVNRVSSANYLLKSRNENKRRIVC